ncbi:MAG: hypothetical protein AAF657_01265 [Acidobacteriota bacterium]
MSRIHPILFASLLTLFLAPPASGLQITPDVGSEGTEVRVDCAANPNRDAAVLVAAPGGGGVLVREVRPDATGLVGIVGAAPGVLVGEVEVWWGRRYELPETLVETPGVVFLTQSPHWFVGQAIEPMTGLFTVDRGSPVTLGAPLSAKEIQLDVDILTTAGGAADFGVRVDIVVDGGNSVPPRPPGFGGPGLKVQDRQSVRTLDIASLDIAFIPAGHTTGASTLSGAELAAGLADVLNATFGSLGLAASSQGSVLSIAHQDGDSTRGFANLKLCSSAGCD